MIVGCGVDVVDHARVERELARGEWLLPDGIFSARELRYCAEAKQRALRFAQCFAAKEAALKALGVTVPDLAVFREVEVVGPAGKRALRLHGRLQARLGAAQRLHFSLGGTRQTSVAIAILES